MSKRRTVDAAPTDPAPLPRIRAGMTVRVRVAGRRVRVQKRRLDGKVGTVVMADAGVVIVDFAAERVREQFHPAHLEPAA